MSGEDRATFLHAMLSNAVATLAPGQGTYAALLHVNGRMVSDLRLFVREGHMLLACEATALPRLAAVLEKYVIAEDVELRDASADWRVVAIAGPRAAELVAAAGFDGAGLAPHAQRDAGSGAFLVGAGPGGALPGLELWMPAVAGDELTAELDRGRAQVGGLWAGSLALEAARIGAGIPRFGVDMTEETLPPEAGIEPAAISSSKGCYVGQETMARIAARGHVNKHLVRLRLHAERRPLPGTPLAAREATIGRITSVSPIGPPLALAMLRREYLEPGTLVEVGDPAGVYPAEVESPVSV